MTTFVLVHPAWFGGWCWRKVSPVLRARGHEVFAPTLTGLGERAHLASQKVGLEMHVEDVANVLEYEDLRQVILVGNSSGGMVITGVADRMPERIAHLVYLDAFVPEDGQSMLDIIPAERRPLMEALVQKEVSGWFYRASRLHRGRSSYPRRGASPTRTASAGSCLVCGRPRSATSKSRCAGTIPRRKNYRAPTFAVRSGPTHRSTATRRSLETQQDGGIANLLLPTSHSSPTHSKQRTC